MEAAEVSRAVAAATSIAEGLGLPAGHARVLSNSNKLTLRLWPADVLARVAPAGPELAQFEVNLALRLAEAGAPVAALDPRVTPRGYQRDGFEVTLWTYYETVTPHISAAEYARALRRLHASMRTIDVPAPHFTDRVADVPGHVASTRALDDADRQLLSSRLRDLRQAVQDRGAPEQLLHGEPHPGNVLGARTGPVFIDLETCCRGPVEFDLAHVPVAVSQHYPEADPALLEDCRGLVLAVVAKHRCDPGDQFPDGPRALRDLLAALRAGPPWAALDVVMGTR
jgi:aminoglycoside phosphotransferase (APT) family kinase protein